MTVKSHDEAQIRQVMAELEIAMRAGDAERVVARYSPDVVKFDLAPPLRHLGSQVRDAAGLRAWFAGFDGPVDYEITELTTTIGDDVAFCHSLNRLSARPHGVPEGFDLWFRATTGLRRLEGRWQVTHEHTSTPFYMDGSFKAAVDLKP
jgi:ketosteroid isomerase-like protein